MKRILFSIIAFGLCAGAMAIPAKPGFVAYTQPDGSVINVKMVGDGHGHMVYSELGHLLVNVDGRMEYAKFDLNGYPISSGIVVSSENESKISSMKIQTKDQLDRWTERVLANRNIRLENNRSKSVMTNELTRSEEENERLVPLNFGRCSVTFPVLGEQKVLVILVAYADVGFKYGDYDYFNRMLNEEGFSDYGSLSSAKDWFVYNSDGKFVPDFDVYGPVTLPNNRAYYGENDIHGSDKRPHEMVIDACKLLDDQIDFAQYDRDGDGVIDNVFVFYADMGEHDSNKEEAVWPHSWDVSAATNVEYIFDGVKLDHYACACEYPSGYRRPDGIGTFVHEFSHVMGLPDLYVTSSSSNGIFTPGEWSVMDQGPYNNDRLTPPNYSAWEKCALGWLDFQPFTEGRMELTDLSTTNVAYALPTDNKKEFYFFENRQQIGNDKFLPGHGMLVWHVDYDSLKWWENVVNNTMNHQNVDIIEADNIKSDTTTKGDTFPGSKNVTSLGFETKPQLASWSKQRLAYDLEDIAESNDGVVSFKAVSNESNAVDIIDVANDTDNIYYDLTGRRVANPGKGIYIVNGKKVIR